MVVETLLGLSLHLCFAYNFLTLHTDRQLSLSMVVETLKGCSWDELYVQQQGLAALHWHVHLPWFIANLPLQECCVLSKGCGQDPDIV